MSAKSVKSFCWTTAFVAVMFLSSIAFAQQGGGAAGGAGGQPDLIGGMDKDKDGDGSLNASEIASPPSGGGGGASAGGGAPGGAAPGAGAPAQK